VLRKRTGEERMVSQEWMNLWISLRNGENGLLEADIRHRLSCNVSAVGPPEPVGMMYGQASLLRLDNPM
jgi:hypothetical protein